VAEMSGTFWGTSRVISGGGGFVWDGNFPGHNLSREDVSKDCLWCVWIPMLDYKFLCVAVIICAILHTHAHRQLLTSCILSAQPAENIFRWCQNYCWQKWHTGQGCGVESLPESAV